MSHSVATGVSNTAAHATAVRPAQPPMRLTRRGRRVVATLASAALIVTFNAANALQASAHDTAPATRVLTVSPGQSLWSIALAVAPGRDPRETIWKIQQLNGLTDSSVVDGQKLLVPSK